MNKTLVPIVFAFDNNIIMPACICISSLLMNAKPDTFYEIFILYSSKEPLKREQLDKIPGEYTNCRITYVSVDGSFDSAYEVRGVTKATYYRLLVPEILPEYDKVIYSDVDIIFRLDLAEVYTEDYSDYYIAATLDLGLNQEVKHLEAIGVSPGEYLQAGFAVLNLKKMREDNMVKVFKRLGECRFTYQDQDILNIACKGKIKYLPPCYNVNDCSFIQIYYNSDNLPGNFTKAEYEFATKKGNIHYSGSKPWRKNSIALDVWWEYYRKSIFFDERLYFTYFFDSTRALDALSLWKRLKILARYFILGRYKGLI